MSDAQDTPEIDPAAWRAEQRLLMLGELAEIGIALARALKEKVRAAEPEAVDAPAMTMAFARVSRAVRQSLWLQEKLEAGAAERKAKAAKAAESQPFWSRLAQSVAPKDPRPPHPRRTKLMDVMAELIDREAGDTQAELEAMESDFCECMEDYGERDFERRPLSAIIAEICQALDILPDWDRWADQDWAIEEAQANSPGSPYAGRTPVEATRLDIPLLAKPSSLNGSPPYEHPP